jgi:hypothetical protein
MRRIVIVVTFLLCCLAYQAHAQYQTRQFRIPTAETNSGVPIAVDPTTLPVTTFRRSRDEFKIIGKAKRSINPATSKIEIQGLIAWIYNGKPTGFLIYSYEDGQIFRITRDSSRGREAYGFGAEYLDSLAKKGIKVLRKGDIDFSRPYILHRFGNSYEAENDLESNRLEKLYSLLDRMMNRALIPLMDNQPAEQLDRTLYEKAEIGDYFNSKVRKDIYWQDENGKIYKVGLDSLKSYIETELSAIAKREKEKAMVDQNRTIAEKVKK